jgi:hypothetical protein
LAHGLISGADDSRRAGPSKDQNRTVVPLRSDDAERCSVPPGAAGRSGDLDKHERERVMLLRQRFTARNLHTVAEVTAEARATSVP